MAIHPLDGVIHAPEFPTDLDWLNTDRAFTLADLNGKIVLIDFWTYCCINCMHVLPELKRLEQKYPNELVVIGVHSAKFTTEKETRAIEQAIQRYEIDHPVVNDCDFEIWKAYNIHAWPSFMLINPTGRIVGTHSGEGIYPLFDPLISKLIAHFDKKNALNPAQIKIGRSTTPHQTLSFPGKIHAANDQLFIADTNHNRVIITDLNGHIQDTIGSGAEGQSDGTFEDSTWQHPQGLYLVGDQLYIADTGNHLIRQVNLATRTVQTILGTGQQAQQFNLPGTGKMCALNSPWDLLVHKSTLYVAMAGAHQIWSVDLNGFHARPHAGSSREELDDGSLLMATLAQPSGITTNGTHLFFADSETSAIRHADIHPSGHIETLIGEALFQFGDQDGPYPTARLQHPMGITYYNGVLYIADTYNHKIKTIDPNTKTATTLAGSSKGHRDG
ncbi:MAG: redoxin domain-containing protein, partial [Candidatus Latescibacteria bacterium]|nr:redoxin domain-containing protein [Candidatus Latescibacterota bacterium]